MQPVFEPFFMQGVGPDILPTFVLIVTLLRDGACRTSGNTFPAAFISKEEAVLSEMAVFFLTRRQLQKSYDAPDSHRDPFGGDEPIV